MSVRKRWLSKPLGFSLLELMVVVAILGVLATVAVPRFNIFRARSRQAEAKSNLGVIYTLQESYNIEHETYYNGAAITGGAAAMHNASSAVGYRGGGGTGTTCNPNKLGFTLANCGQTRYGYMITGGNENAFLAVAYAPSDTANGSKRIFPGCEGSGAAKQPNAPCTASGATNGNFSKGDAWCLDEGRDLENYRDIAEYCNQ